MEKLAGVTVVAGMSGGVDSAVAALRLVRAGARVVGMTLLAAADCRTDDEGSCCHPAEADAARAVAGLLGIAHYRLDEREAFRRLVLTEAVRIAAAGGTPSVCPICNARFKLAALAREADRLGAEFIATGHYARIEHDGGTARLLRGGIPGRDQSYFLYAVPLEIRRRLLLPLGEADKPEVRAEAFRAGFPVHDKPASTDLCPPLLRELERELLRAAPELTRSGPVLDHHGRELGRHDGLWRYTLGQRRGLGTGGGTGWPLYVVGKDPATATLFLGPEELLWRRKLELELLGPRPERWPEGLKCQPRRNHPGAPVEILAADETRLRLRFLAPQRALTPGQAAVLYLDDEVIGGGTVISVA